MFEIHKRLVTDENMRPIAVQIDYADWLKIEKAIGMQSPALKTVDLSRYSGVLELTEEPIGYQDRVRSEWP